DGPLRATAPPAAPHAAHPTTAPPHAHRPHPQRSRPRPDATHPPPPRNPLPPGTPTTPPEIYTMGNRNAWRLSIDSRTGYLHWGEIGPDAGRDSVGVGPMGYDEFNVARQAGNFGWPMFIGYNRAYHRYDYSTDRDVEPFDPARPVNPSPNNSGLRELPPALPALIAYPYGGSEEYPLLSSGGRAAVGGPIFRRADFRPDAARVFPAYYEGKWLVVDYVRNWIMAVTMDPGSSRVLRIEPFVPSAKYLNPIDMAFGPEGDLYVVEYGQGGVGKISKVEYNAGNRAPRVTIAADRMAGAAPLRVSLSSEGTVDHDRDVLRYEWVVTPEAGGPAQRFETADPTATLARPGAYRVALTATDPSGARGSAELRVVAGNEPPRVTLNVTRGNRSFYFPGSSLDYRVTATDREDGAIAPGQVKVTAEFVPSGLTPSQAREARALAPEASARNLQAIAIMAGSDCRACHGEETRMVGPAFREVGQKYRGQPSASEYLARRIIAGGGGVWGTTAMPPHPTLTPVEATTLAEYVLSVGAADLAPRMLPLQGTYTTPAPQEPRGDNPARVTQLGSHLLRATYTDRGANGVAPLTSSDVLLLRQPRLAPEDADVISPGTTFAPSRGDPGFVINRSGAYIGFTGIDLTGIDSVAVGVLTRFYTWSHFIGGTVEVRLDSPTGPLLGAPISVTPPAPPAPPQPPAAGQPPRAPTNPARPMVLGGNLEKPVSFPLVGAIGTRDVYVVFRNPEAGPAASLFLVTGIEFKRGARP
ncbi:MAG: PQQ-dependent sugar dehydrogenase, partial [Gemmatimonadetes bacterium]|nr:PQQ-dependent sugar dehydrogenase [Gemmatimonadota bacterium]